MAEGIQSLKVLSLNVHKGFSHFNFRYVLPELRESIRSLEPDLVFLQEVLGENHRHTQKFEGDDAPSQYEYLADSIWAEYAYGKNAIYPEGHHGNAILSKFPISSIQHTNISTYKLEQRGILHCEIEVPRWKTHLHCICVHAGLFSFHRKMQFTQIAKYVEEEVEPQAPLIIAGDLNDWTHRAEDYLAKPLKLSEAFLETTGSLAKSFPVFWPILRLDRIYLRGLQATSTHVYSSKPWSRLSDHAALWAEVRRL